MLRSVSITPISSGLVLVPSLLQIEWITSTRYCFASGFTVMKTTTTFIGFAMSFSCAYLCVQFLWYLFFDLFVWVDNEWRVRLTVTPLLELMPGTAQTKLPGFLWQTGRKRDLFIPLGSVVSSVWQRQWPIVGSGMPPSSWTEREPPDWLQH